MCLAGDPAYLSFLSQLVQLEAQNWCNSSHGLIGDIRLLTLERDGAVLMAISKSPLTAVLVFHGITKFSLPFYSACAYLEILGKAF